MLQVTKIFRFEMAHAITGYNGPCKNIHGHSYELHVKASTDNAEDEYLPAPGFVIDFKDLKSIVYTTVISKLDHKLVLSRQYLSGHQELASQENLFIWDVEPTAENLLIFFLKNIRENLPPGIRLTAMKLYETNNSYAEWIDSEAKK